MTVAAGYGRTQGPAGTNDLTSRWPGKIGLAAALGAAYFVTARLSLGLLLEPDGVAVFWPASGISAGVLIALGPKARWPVAVGVLAAAIPANLMSDRNLPAAIAFAFCGVVETLIIALLVHHAFGPSLRLGRLRAVLGLFAAAFVGSAVSAVLGAISSKLFHSPDVPMLTSWWHWFASDVVGVLAVAPLIIGITASIRRPPVRGEIPEALAALGVLTAMTILVMVMPPRAWETALPGALLAPIFLWLAARFRSVFSAVGGFMVSLAVVWTTIDGIGHFGDTRLPVQDRIFQAQVFVLVVMLGAMVLAALFAERRRVEANLVRSNALLARERDNKLMNVEAVTAAIAHEIRQPLSAIALDGAAALKLLERTPPDYQQVRECLSGVITGAHNTNEIFNSVRNLFRQVDQTPRPTNINEIVLGVLSLVRGELQDGGVTQRIILAPELPLVPGSAKQLHEVILNLVHNALEAMENVTGRRVLQVRTELHGTDAIVVTVRDSGPGIANDKLDKIFDPFFTTKTHGMGLGLAISRMIVERHHGQLTAASDGKNGAAFSVILPLAFPDEAHESEPTRAS